MAKNSIYDYSTTASNNTDIAGVGILGTNAVSNFDDAFRTIMAQIATDVSPRRLSIQGALYGLTLSNNAGDAVNDIDIAVGMATTDSTTDPRTMVLATAITKRLDAAWAVGTNQGGLDTGSIANTTYHIWLIQRSDTGVVDALFSTSATSPTMPSGYDRKRRIGSILRESAAIVAFTQNGNDFSRAPVQDLGVATTTTNVLITLSVPAGIVVQPKMELRLVLNQTTNANIQFGSGFESVSPHVVQAARAATGATAEDATVINGGFFTNTSRQLNHSRGATSGSINLFTLVTSGWIDNLGRF